jgi:hypothetical protein
MQASCSGPGAFVHTGVTAMPMIGRRVSPEGVVHFRVRLHGARTASKTMPDVCRKAIEDAP